jgi:hypothetical protein
MPAIRFTLEDWVYSRRPVATMAFMALKSAGGSAIFNINATEIVSKMVTTIFQKCLLNERHHYFTKAA